MALWLVIICEGGAVLWLPNERVLPWLPTYTNVLCGADMSICGAFICDFTCAYLNDNSIVVGDHLWKIYCAGISLWGWVAMVIDINRWDQRSGYQYILRVYLWDLPVSTCITMALSGMITQGWCTELEGCVRMWCHHNQPTQIWPRGQADKLSPCMVLPFGGYLCTPVSQWRYLWGSPVEWCIMMWLHDRMWCHYNHSVQIGPVEQKSSYVVCLPAEFTCGIYLCNNGNTYAPWSSPEKDV